MLTVIYTRISSAKQSSIFGDFISIENQTNKCIEYCNNNLLYDYTIIEEVVSARNIKKQKKLYELLNNKNMNIIFYNITRYSRNSTDALIFQRMCASNNIILHFVNENIKTDNHMDLHRFRTGISQSEFESDTISHRIKGTNSLLKSKGWNFGKPEYGKKTIFKNQIRKNVKNEYEINIIEFIILAKEGINCSKLNKQLLKLNSKDKTPIEFIDYDGITKIDNFSKINTLNFQEIANLLNSYDIFYRNKIWTKNNVNRIYKIYNKKNDLNSSLFIKRLNKLKIN